MAQVEYIPDALIDDFTMFCDDIRRIPSWTEFFAHGPSISALRIPAGDSEAEQARMVTVARDVLFPRSNRVNSSRLWIFLAHYPWQNDSRVVNYRKIWKSLGMTEK